MEHLLRVTLDKSTHPWTVDIDQNGNANHIARNAQPQTIVWALEGDAAGGQCNRLAGSRARPRASSDRPKWPPTAGRWR